MSHETRLAEMIATRLCHDLTGPIGAVNNGAEFLEDEGFDMTGDAIKLILTSAHEAVNRLQFYRQAYGRVGDTGEASLAEKKKIAEDFFSNTKVKLDWPDSHTDAAGMAVSQKMSRLLLNMMIIAAGSAIRGGTLSVRLAVSDCGDKQIDVSIVGDTIKIDPDMAAILSGASDAVPLTPKSAQPYLAVKLAEELAAKLSLTHDAGSLALKMVQPATVLAAAV